MKSPRTDGDTYCTGLFCGKCATRREINGHAFLFQDAEQGNPVENRDTVCITHCAVSAEDASFLRKQVIGKLRRRGATAER